MQNEYQPQKKPGSMLLKVTSIILIVCAGLAIVAGIVLCAGGGALAPSFAESISNTYEASALSQLTFVFVMVGVGVIIAGAAMVVIGIVGLKASAVNGKNTAAFVLGIIGIVCAGISAIASIQAGAPAGCLGLILPILYLIGVNQTRQGANA